jgi:hypothetical protein
MEPVLYILAFAGVSALLLRIGRALFVLLHRAGQAWLAGEAASRRHEHGDITGLVEAAERERMARLGRRIATTELILWLALLIVPPFTPWTREIYAACALLWIFVRARVRHGTLVDVRRIRP